MKRTTRHRDIVPGCSCNGHISRLYERRKSEWKRSDLLKCGVCGAVYRAASFADKKVLLIEAKE